MNVVIVESPAKAKTIQKYLGADFQVLASYGHIRDLPSRDGSVRPDQDFAMDWEVDPRAAKRLKEIASAVKRADKLILATDPDREGEAISWHVLEFLRQNGALADIDVERVAFNAITRTAVREAVAHPRSIDKELVEAYLARRALDYLVGFTLSPVLWRKVPGSRSAGRVQSVALRLVCDRELEIERFTRDEYWTVETEFETGKGEHFEARLFALNGEKLKRFDLPDSDAAHRARTVIEHGAPVVATVESKPARRHPQAPFITSTLQQEAARKLGFAASRTMQVAQRLYEGADIGGETVGLITYMRTDGVQMVAEAIEAARAMIKNDFGTRYVPRDKREYRSKARSAQEAHEAIRPTDFNLKPDDVAKRLDSDQARLYELIWKRAVASQMESAELERTTVDIEAGDGKAVLRATGSVIVFDGFLKLYQEGADDSEGGEADRRLPAMTEGDRLKLVAVTPTQHFTEPPPRFTEATLVKRLEELGIGRPSTYATILSVLRDRSYVRMEKNRFIPEDKGRIVTAFLESFFKRYVEYDFTASLEEKLDLIASGDLAWKSLLDDFWREFAAAVDDIKDLKVSDVLEALNELLSPHIFPPREAGTDARQCPSCSDGRLSLKLGRFGAFIGCSRYPDCSFTRPLTATNDEGGGTAGAEPRILGDDPETGEPISLRTGRFGPYVQRGDSANGAKPPRSSVPKDMAAEDMDLTRAVALLSLPRTVGPHPETQEPITASIGRYGPYVLHQGQYANLESSEEVFSVGLNRAVAVLAEKKARGSGRPSSRTLKSLGSHPEDGKPVELKDGRYGPYVCHGGINATLPKGSDVATVTLAEALGLIAARAERQGAKKPKRSTSHPTKSKAKGKAKGKAEAKPAKSTPKKTQAKKKKAVTSKTTATRSAKKPQTASE